MEGTTDVTGPRPLRPARELPGRAAELEEMLGAAEEAVSGRGSVALVSGEAGIGKSRLVGELAVRLERSGMAVAWGRCQLGGSAYWPWLQILRSLNGGLLPLDVAARIDGSADVRSADAEADRLVLFAAVVEALRAAATVPLVLVVEDVHWADTGSANLLEFVATEIDSLPALLIATVRDSESPAELLDGVRCQRHLSLRGLKAADLARAVEMNTRERVSDELVVALHERTRGNPFFSAEIVRLLRSEGRLETRAVLHALPFSVRAALDRRLARLPTPVFALLQTAAILGDEFDGRVVAEIAALDASSAFEHLQCAVGAMVVREIEPGRHAFAHALFGEALRAAVPVEFLRRQHERAADVLRARAESGVADDASVARHRVAAAEAGGPVEPAVQPALVAARSAMRRHASEEARDLLADALRLQLSDPEAGDRFELLLAFGEAAVAAGDPEAAREAHREAATLARRRHDRSGLGHAALAFAGGAIGFEVSLLDAEQIALLEDALHEQRADSSAVRVELMARLSVALTHTGMEHRRKELANVAVALARQVGDARGIAAALCAQCDAMAGPDDVGARLSASKEIIALATAADDRLLELLGRRLRLVALAESGEWAGVDAEIDAYALTASGLGQPRVMLFVPLWRGMRALMRGDFEDAEQFTDQAHDLAVRAHSLNGVVLAASQAFDRLFFEGRLEDALDAMLSSVDDPSTVGVPGDDLATMIAVCSPDDEARRALDRLTEHASRRVKDSEWLGLIALIGETALRVEHRQAAELVYERLAAYAGIFVIDGIGAASWGSVDGYLARLANQLGRSSERDRHFEHALELERRGGTFLFERLRRELGASAAFRPSSSAEAVWRRDGDVWMLRFLGRTVRANDTKGMRDLATLLSAPGTSFHVSELIGVAPERDAGEMSDRRAIAAYRSRLAELEEEIADAEAMHDPVRAERAATERDALVDELSAVAGLGGRARRAGSAVERMRKTVRFRVRTAIGRVSHVHPELGRHLEVSIRTGTFCSYEPERPMHWQR